MGLEINTTTIYPGCMKEVPARREHSYIYTLEDEFRRNPIETFYGPAWPIEHECNNTEPTCGDIIAYEMLMNESTPRYRLVKTEMGTVIAIYDEKTSKDDSIPADLVISAYAITNCGFSSEQRIYQGYTKETLLALSDLFREHAYKLER